MYVDVSVLLIDDGKWKVNKFIREEKTISHIFLIYFALWFLFIMVVRCAMLDQFAFIWFICTSLCSLQILKISD